MARRALLLGLLAACAAAAAAAGGAQMPAPPAQPYGSPAPGPAPPHLAAQPLQMDDVTPLCAPLRPGARAPPGSCFVPTALYPRACACLRCGAGSQGERLNCDTCRSPSGASYPTHEACMSAGAAAAARAAAEYPPPTYPPTAACGAPRPPAAGRTGCPHLEPGLAAWEDPATWPDGRVPAAGADAALPAGARVLLGACAARLYAGAALRSVTVPPGAELVLDDADAVLRLTRLEVRGRLRAGSPTCRLGARLTLEFVGSPGIDDAGMGIFALGGGTVDLFGRDFRPTWTRLAATAAAGATALALRDAVRWAPGQQVVVTTSAWRDELDNRNEVATIAGVSADGRTLALAAPLAFQHYGGPEYQSEVGLLSRSILFLAADGAAAEAARRGPQLRLEAPGSRVAGVQAFRAGALNVKGAYPFHFHAAGDAAGSFFSDCSVYRSFYRCFTVHATNNALLQWNVAFDAAGSCFYVEDGVEEGNWLDRNLAAYVHPIGAPAGGADQRGADFAEGPGLAQPADAGAAGFYLANPGNRVTRCAASGGVSGFAIPVLDKPIGLSRGAAIVPAARPLLEFSGNTAHSSGYFSRQTGGCFYFGGRLWEEGGALRYSSGRHSFPTVGKNGAPATPVITDNAAWLCNAGLLFWGARLDVRGWRAADAVRGLTLLSASVVERAVFVGETNNTAAAGFLENRADYEVQAAFQWYDTATSTILKDATFSRWRHRPELGAARPAVFYSMTHSDRYKPEGMSATLNVKYVAVDADAVLRVDYQETGASRFFNFRDADGSATRPFTGAARAPAIVGSWPDWWRLDDARCGFQRAWGAWVCPARRDQTVARLDIRIPGLTRRRDVDAAPPTPDNYIGSVAAFGGAPARGGGKRRAAVVTRNEGITGVTGPTGWFLALDGGAPREAQLWLTQVPPGFYVLFATRYPPGTAFDIQRVVTDAPRLSSRVAPAASLDEALRGDGTKYWWDGRFLYLKVVDPEPLPAISRPGVAVWGTRWWSAYYSVVATNLGAGQTPLPADGAEPPSVMGTPAAAEPAEPAAAAELGRRLGVPAAAAPACGDLPPQGLQGGSCAAFAAAGRCGEAYAAAGGYCGLTCGRCGAGARAVGRARGAR